MSDAITFDQPYVDIDEERSEPTPHRYVHGGFSGTETRFSYYFPPADRYEGRFFQHVTPVPLHENLAQEPCAPYADKISMSFEGGAYYVESNGGGAEGLNTDVGSFAANAAVAAHSRVVAAEVYGDHRPYGYLHGGSGGAYRTIGSMQNTDDVWDGFAPYVPGTPLAIPNVFTVRMRAMRLLDEVLDEVEDALEPGGPAIESVLDDEQLAVYREAAAMGFPTGAWVGHDKMDHHAFPVLFNAIRLVDPDYFAGYWTTPGYEGHDRPELFERHRVEVDTTVTELVAAATGGDGPEMLTGGVDRAFDEGNAPPVGIRVAELPEKDLLTADLVLADGTTRLLVKGVEDGVVLLDDPDGALASVSVGDPVRLDNTDLLAVQTYHRHQDPQAEYPGQYAVWDQFRHADGGPVYPQRPFLVGPGFTRHAAGAIPDGTVKGKMIMVAAGWDREAYPWQADWYRQRVAGRYEDADDRFRLWFAERTLHGDQETLEDPTRVINYLGVLQQALRDLAAWVEDGIEPPASSGYEVVDGQVLLAPTAEERGSVQPVVTLTADGGERAEVAAGSPVTLKVVAEAPPGTGTIVAVDWDLDGSGTFAVLSPVSGAESRVEIELVHTFDAPGTHFPTVRVGSRRDGDTHSPFARPLNLGRARVVAT